MEDGIFFVGNCIVCETLAALCYACSLDCRECVCMCVCVSVYVGEGGHYYQRYCI